jgi:hypothetical protein
VFWLWVKSADWVSRDTLEMGDGDRNAGADLEPDHGVLVLAGVW